MEASIAAKIRKRPVETNEYSPGGEGRVSPPAQQRNLPQGRAGSIVCRPPLWPVLRSLTIETGGTGGTGATGATDATGATGCGGLAYRLTDTFGLVLFLILLDYVAVSTLLGSGWGRVCTVFLSGATLVFTLRVCQSRHIWQVLAVIYLVASTLLAILVELAPRTESYSQAVSILGGVVLLATPFVILRRIATHRVIVTDTVLGAVCVYLLIGFSFAFIYSVLAMLTPTPFFTRGSPSTINNTLFFSYSTLTTVGYGNLVPAASLGQSVAMLEALFGQIYLILIVARLVSLWGQERPAPAPMRPERPDVPGEPQRRTPPPPPSDAEPPSDGAPGNSVT